MAEIQTQSSRDHFALKLIIRGTGIVLALGCGFVVFGGVMLICASVFHHPSSYWYFGAVMGGIMAAFFGLVCKAGYDMARRINATSAENCAFVYAVLTARTLYYSLEYILKTMGVDPHTPIFHPVIASEHVLSWLGLFAFLSFFLFRYLYAAGLKQVLELNPSPPSSGHGDKDSIPEFPDKSPLIELR